MTPEEREIVTALGSVILGTFREQSIIVLLYGIFIPLGVLCVHDFVRKPAHRKTACIMLFGALFATCLLIVETGQVVLYLRLGMIDNTATPLTDKRETTDIVIQPWSKAVSACQLVPLLTNDTLLIWRAWVIFARRRWALYILSVFWLTTAGVMLSTLVTYFAPISNTLEHVTFGLTFGTNLVATCLIGYILWGHRRMFKSTAHFQGEKTWKVLVLLFEMGFIYCILQVVAVISDSLTPAASVPLIQWSGVDVFMDILYTICTMLSTLYPIIVALVIQGPSVMLGIHETAASTSGQSNTHVE
ncbi:hypothetical protein E4T56_gene11317 [Termitomyces sp. T112]|nr:hypothetical protein E4T56_gene11317 [Termitomyces sp. T112]